MGVDIIVGTPGRIIDLLERGVLNLANIQYFVCDEVTAFFFFGLRTIITSHIRILVIIRILYFPGFANFG